MIFMFFMRHFANGLQNNNEVSQAEWCSYAISKVMKDTIVLLDGEEMWDRFFNLRIGQVCGDIFPDKAVESQIMEKLSQGPNS